MPFCFEDSFSSAGHNSHLSDGPCGPQADAFSFVGLGSDHMLHTSAEDGFITSGDVLLVMPVTNHRETPFTANVPGKTIKPFSIGYVKGSARTAARQINWQRPAADASKQTGPVAINCPFVS